MAATKSQNTLNVKTISYKTNICLLHVKNKSFFDSKLKAIYWPEVKHQYKDKADEIYYIAQDLGLICPEISSIDERLIMKWSDDNRMLTINVYENEILYMIGQKFCEPHCGFLNKNNLVKKLKEFSIYLYSECKGI